MFSKKLVRKSQSHRVLGIILSLALLAGLLPCIPAQRVQAAGENLIENPNFADGDLSMWMNTGATVTAGSQEEEILEGVKTYATISGRSQSYQGFSQDVTDKVKPGAEYEVSFYVKLSEQYQSLGGAERTVFFGPYVVEDGETKYLSQAYSGEIGGELLKEVPAGQWVQLSGTYQVSESATQVVVRFQEEGSKAMGDYSITGVSMKLKDAGTAGKSTPPKYEFEDIPILKDVITAALGEDAIVGMVTHPVDNKKEWALLTKHANAVTTGNELKPDSNFGYSNSKCPGTETVTFNGQQMLVPKVDWSRGEKFVNAVWKYNQENPDNQIRIRGHVLVWHAQTPEWFFHEDYEADKPYVSKEELDRRLEWYIKTILEHYVGPDSKYKDMFYGWDVVNEACVGGAAVYRDDQGGTDKLTDSTHDNKSSWWHVYQSNEYIINAFKYANKYAPESVELYYNDFGEIWPDKVTSICELMRAVKEQEGEPGVGTRIDAFGMQAHYGLNDFSIENFESAARQYLDVVGKIQLTELDMAASSNYDGTEATQDQEYMDQALCFQSIFEVLKKLEAIDGYDVGGITFWGVTDPNSWLQSRNTVGGGSDGTRKQCPLLFDGNYEAKPAYWAFVDPSKIKIVQKNVECRRSYDGKNKEAVSYAFEAGSVSATLIPIWNEEGLELQVEVKDKSLDAENDYVTVYVVEETEGREGITPKTYTKNRKESSAVGGGYKVKIQVPLEEIFFGKQFLFDVKVTDGGKAALSFNDIQMMQDSSSRNYALCTLKPAMMHAAKGTPVIDGDPEELWNTTESIWLNSNSGAAVCSAKVKLLWDTKKLYVLAAVEDPEISEQDSVEICIDEDYARGISYGRDDKRYIISADNVLTCFGSKASEKITESAVKRTEKGYVIEASFEWTKLSAKVHNMIGVEFKVNDANASGTLLGTLNWSDTEGVAAETPSSFGTIKLAVAGEALEEGENPDAAITRAGAQADNSAASEAEGQEPDAEQTPSEAKKPEEEQKVSGGAVAFSCILIAALLGISFYLGFGAKQLEPSGKQVKQNTQKSKGAGKNKKGKKK